MRRKGFTLVELVISFLGLIMLVSLVVSLVIALKVAPAAVEYVDEKAAIACRKDCDWECSKMETQPADCVVKCSEACIARRSIGSNEEE